MSFVSLIWAGLFRRRTRTLLTLFSIVVAFLLFGLLRSIADAYARMEGAATPEELLEPDLAFHRRIAEATQNDLLAYIGNMLSLALRESIKLSSRHPNTHELSLPRHKAILTALLNRDPLAAYQATLVQLNETREDISAILESGLDPR